MILETERKLLIEIKIIDENIIIKLWLRKKYILIIDIKQISIFV